MCRLNNLKNKKILLEILAISSEELRSFVQQKKLHYRVREIPKPDGTKRVLEVPDPKLKAVHARIKHQLSLLVAPDYLHSGVKGRSFVTNALVHQGARSMLTLDIRKFYPSCSRKAVERYFRRELGQPKDIASLLADISTFDEHIPTGSPVSQILAFWAKSQAFNEIARYAKNRGLKLTLYVDDITFSSDKDTVPRHVYADVSGILKKYDLQIKRSKAHFYDWNADKRVTGNIIKKSGEIVAPNKMKRKLFKSVLKKSGGQTSALSEKEVLSALGILRTINMIEGTDSFPCLHRNLRSGERTAQTVLGYGRK